MPSSLVRPLAPPLTYTPPVPAPPLPSSALSRWLGPIGSALLLILLIAALAAIGRVEGASSPSQYRLATVAAAYWSILISAPLAAAYLLAGVGLGRLANPLFRGSRSALWIQSAVGVGLMLWLSHLLGTLGLLSGHAGMYAAWAAIALGLFLLLDQVFRGDLRPENWPVAPGWIIVAVPGLAITLVAACSPPGWLWESEKAGFDVRSYHLQLAREWADGPRLWPLAHNVYSYLPGYVEAAYTHIAAMMRIADGPIRPGSPPPPALISGTGIGILACQMLHAGLGLLTALLTARAVFAMLSVASTVPPTIGSAMVGAAYSKHPEPVPPTLGSAIVGADHPQRPSPLSSADIEVRHFVSPTLPAILSGAIFLSIPWIIVVGSLAYNELAVTALSAGALLAAADTSATPWRRGTLAGLLVGLACSAKPTAALLVTPWVAFALLGLMPARRWPIAGITGTLAAAAATLPWLIRNYVPVLNPIFPFGTRWFGIIHWTNEQADRYAAAHHADPAADRLSLLFSTDRGILHDQWSLLFPAALVAFAIAAASPRTQRPAILLGLGTLASLTAWLVLTHVQSRFLIPLAVPMAALLGLAAFATLSAARRLGASALPRVARALALAAAPIALATRAVFIFATQNDLRPNALLAPSIPDLTGASMESEFAVATDVERNEFLAHAPSPEVFANLGIDPDKTIYLLGDSAPLYFKGSILYHTTWDRSPLGDAIRAHPDDDSPWVDWLRAQGVRYILVNMAELHRLCDIDHWYDPDVTPDLALRFTARWCDPIRAWPQSGQYLVRLRDRADGPADRRSP